jgi:hypothetical protein
MTFAAFGNRGMRQFEVRPRRDIRDTRIADSLAAFSKE